MKCESQWTRALRHELSSPVQTQGSRVQIPLEAWMPVCVYEAWMSVCLHSVFVLSYVGSGLARADPPSKEYYRLCKRSRN
jgi:hypothetical protein